MGLGNKWGGPGGRVMLVVSLTLAMMGCGSAVCAAAKPPPAAPCAPPAPVQTKAADDSGDVKPGFSAPRDSWSPGTVTAGGTKIDYCAVAGTLTVHPKGWDDSARTETSDENGGKNPTASASMFYVAYFQRNTSAATRPLTFLFNGGPGSASLWLHMGAFGPRRVETADARHSPPPPYRLVNNDHSLLDASDLVFIDAPGTGFSRITGDDKEKSFYGIDEDAHAFGAFITGFLTKYKRWNSPKYLFGESYGTTRAAVLISMLQENPGVDFNGLIMLSQVLSSSFYPDRPRDSPGNDLPYLLALPTYAATAWYHRQPPDQRSTAVPRELLAEVERFAMGEYAIALAAGGSLDALAREAVVAKLQTYTGLPAEYLRRADLRVSADEFRQELLHGQGLTVGGTDTRFSGDTLDRTGRHARYDPSDAAIGSAYVSSFNDYVRRVLKYSDERSYRPQVDEIIEAWNFMHQPLGGAENNPPSERTVNVIPDLARAMKYNPLLKVQLNAGYFDLLTPYFQGMYEMRHLPVPARLRDNIEYRYYESGHLVYLSTAALSQLHGNAADFIARTSARPAPPAR